MKKISVFSRLTKVVSGVIFLLVATFAMTRAETADGEFPPAETPASGTVR